MQKECIFFPHTNYIRNDVMERTMQKKGQRKKQSFFCYIFNYCFRGKYFMFIGRNFTLTILSRPQKYFSQDKLQFI